MEDEEEEEEEEEQQQQQEEENGRDRSCLTTLPPSFWDWYEDDHGHVSPCFHEDRGRVHGFLPSFLLAEGWMVGHDHALPFLRLRRAEYHPQKEGGKVAMTSSFPLLGSGGVWPWSPSITLLEGGKEGNHASIARGGERHWGR